MAATLRRLTGEWLITVQHDMEEGVLVVWGGQKVGPGRVHAP